MTTWRTRQPKWIIYDLDESVIVDKCYSSNLAKVLIKHYSKIRMTDLEARRFVVTEEW